ncbi:MAG: lysylphosphatidylglycerol synthase domain-containing protein [Acetobacteraceae bacterium]|nr:lysylphosphatidylglycerol synthase domain-containing protein [Acetobacteraceae bacterium]
MTRWGPIIALMLGGVALAVMLLSVGLQPILAAIALGGPALPAALVIHGAQLSCAGLAWREALGERRLSGWFVARVRWIREGINTLLPAAHIGGQVVGVRLLVQARVAPVRAVVGTILDVVLETGAQALVVLTAVLWLFAVREGAQDKLTWIGAGLGGLGLTVAGLLVALRLGVLRAAEAALERVASRWPGSSAWSMEGLHETLMRRQADRAAMGRALLLNAASWSLGTFEVWVFLRAMGVVPGLDACFLIESLAMAARSAGFFIPGAVGVQEGGFVLACGLFGIETETALALSVLKRLRELAIGGLALVVWQCFSPRPVRSGPST